MNYDDWKSTEPDNRYDDPDYDDDDRDDEDEEEYPDPDLRRLRDTIFSG